jgi:hypothetical protein
LCNVTYFFFLQAQYPVVVHDNLELTKAYVG